MCSTVFTRKGCSTTQQHPPLRVDPYGQHPDRKYPGEASICGMASRELQGLYGLNREDNTLVRIDTETADLRSSENWAGKFGRTL